MEIRHFLPMLASIGRNQMLLLAHGSVDKGPLAGKPVTDVTTNVYARKSTSNPQWLVNVLLTPVLWLPQYS